jgi:tetratricopeptide (TPR) repeat protein
MAPNRHLFLIALVAAILVPGVMRGAALPAEHLTQWVTSLLDHPTDDALRNRIKGEVRKLQEPADEELLGATPISRARMELIWLEPAGLRDLAAKVKAAGGSVSTVFYDSSDDDRREYLIRQEDIRWAQGIEKLVDFAFEAGQARRFEEAVHFYKQALLLAPGGDLFLMSVGVGYVQMGENDRGLRFLQRAAQLSPTNGRIRRNLEKAKLRSHS